MHAMCRSGAHAPPPLLPARTAPTPVVALQVQRYLQQYIDDIKGLYERHRDACGHKDIPLRVM